MKCWSIAIGATLIVILSGCAGKGNNVPTATLAAQVAGQQSTIRQPNVSGMISVRQRIALPPDSVLTVTLSDASIADAPSKVIAQHVVRTEGKQAPFNFILPYNPADIKPKARILLSAAITVKGRMAFITDGIRPVINNGSQKEQLLLVPMPAVALPVRRDSAAPLPVGSPTQVTPSVISPAPTTL